MTQQIKRNNKIYKFPDDSSLDEINSFFKDEFNENLKSSIIDYLPKVPHGLNIATGLLSLASGPFNSEQADIIKNLPQAAFGTKTKFPQKVEHFIGEMLPGFEASPKAAVGGAKAIKAGIEYAKPHKEIPKLMEKLGAGAETSEQNIANLSSEVSHARIGKEEEALVPKRELIEEGKGKHLYAKGEAPIPKVGEIVKLFGAKQSDLSQDELASISKSLKEYYSNGGDTNKLIKKLEDVLPEPIKDVSKLDNLLPIGKLKSGKYFGSKELTKGYSDTLLDVHNKFVNNTNIETADKLLSQLKTELRNTSQTKELKRDRLSRNISNLTNDLEGFVSTLPKEMKGKYKEFTSKWREKSKIFNQEDVINKLSHGESEGVSSQDIKKVFANPTRETIKLINEINPSIKNHVLYNLLQHIDPKDVKKFANAILDAKKTKGYEQYVDKDMEKLAHELLKRHTISNALKDAALGIGTGALFSNPLIGAGAIGARYLLPHIAKAMSKMMNK